MPLDGTLTKKQIAAAKWIALGESYVKVASRVKVHETTISAWNKTEEFQTAVRISQNQIEVANQRSIEKIVERKDVAHISSKEGRVEVLQTLRAKYFDLIQQRSQYYAENFPTVPGGDTGLIFPKRSGKLDIDHVVDNPTVKTIMELQKEAAEELGQKKIVAEDKSERKLYDNIDESRLISN